MNQSEIREQFPFLKTGLIYLNNAATTPLSTYAKRMLQKYVGERHAGRVEKWIDLMRTFDETRELAAKWIGTTSDRIAFLQNTSEGLNILANGLKWKTGDRILLGEREFPANVYPFLNQRRHGVEIDFVPQKNGRFELSDIESMLTPKTRLVSFSWVQFLSGFTIDMKVLYELCSSRGVLLSIDGIQGLGARRLNLKETPVDFFSAGVHKWQMGMHGLAISYFSQKVQDMIHQPSIGWANVKDHFDFSTYDHELQDTASRYENGTPNTAGIHAYNGALTFFQEVGIDEVMRLVRVNNAHLYEKAMELGFDVITPGSQDERAGIVTFRAENAEAVEGRLLEQNITVSARVGHIRVSPHFYNSIDEIDAALSVIAKTLR